LRNEIKPHFERKMTEETEHQHPTSATRQVRPRVLGVVFGVHFSARSAFRLDPDYSGQSAPACCFLRWWQFYQTDSN